MIIVIGLYMLIWGKAKDQEGENSEEKKGSKSMELPKSVINGDQHEINGKEYYTVVEIQQTKNP